jgi:hypothetical protein
VRYLIFTAAITASLFITGVTVNAQELSQANSENKPTIEKSSVANSKVTNQKSSPAPAYTNYRGIKIGMAADDIRKALGHLKDKSDTQDLYVFSDVEDAQVYYDKDHHVTAISIDYMGAKSDAPTPEQVLGHSIQIKADGSAYALERYPEAGYWVSYNKTKGNDPIVTITLQKL